MSAPINAPPPKPPYDPYNDPTYEPCRDERCNIEGLHRKHPINNKTRGPSKKKSKSLYA